MKIRGRLRDLVLLALGLAVSVLVALAINIFHVDDTLGSYPLLGIAVLFVSFIAGVVTGAQIFPSSKDLARDIKFQDRTIDLNAALGGAQLTLVSDIAELEVDAAKLLPPEQASGRRTIFDLRAGLSSAGIWSSEDVASFNRAVRVRNAIVHADDKSVEHKDIVIALKTVERLKTRIEMRMETYREEGSDYGQAHEY